MKKIVLIALLIGVSALGVSAQQEDGEIFSINRYVIRVYESVYGFKVIYLTNAFQEEEIYIPNRWIYEDKTVLLTYRDKSSVPHMQLYYNPNQTLTLIQLALPRNPLHATREFLSEDGLEATFQNASFQ